MSEPMSQGVTVVVDCPECDGTGAVLEPEQEGAQACRRWPCARCEGTGKEQVEVIQLGAQIPHVRVYL